jgi:hypothetical protein
MTLLSLSQQGGMAVDGSETKTFLFLFFLTIEVEKYERKRYVHPEGMVRQKKFKYQILLGSRAKLNILKF